MLTPSMVVPSVRVIVSPSSCHEGEFCSSGFPMHVHLVLVGLNFILHFFDYDSHIFISFCSPVVVVLKRFMSSAYEDLVARTANREEQTGEHTYGIIYKIEPGAMVR
ncbi:unnamed protein product [Meganyctiphanes norvegica]|uniref:Uncharacterized protein n=1 Tax=Meganyctiphanes norvegica TaxID=48144 RepID=A0AAV2QJH4_MEGNR